MKKSKQFKPLLIVLIGEKLAGKELVGKYLAKQHKFIHYRSSQVLVDILGRLGLPVTRENEVALVGGLRERFGGGVLAEALKIQVKHKKQQRVVIDGIRHPGELDILKLMPGFLLVYVTAPLDLRYQRALQRGEKIGETSFSLPDFKREEKLPTEIHIRPMARAARVTLVNGTTLADLYKQVEEKIVKRYLKS